MKKPALITCLILAAVATPALAHTQHDRAVGDMYTKVLNTIEKEGLLDTLEPKQQVRITDMHIDHGQVLITTTQEGTQKTIIFNMIANRIVTPTADESGQAR